MYGLYLRGDSGDGSAAFIPFKKKTELYYFYSLSRSLCAVYENAIKQIIITI